MLFPATEKVIKNQKTTRVCLILDFWPFPQMNLPFLILFFFLSYLSSYLGTTSNPSFIFAVPRLNGYGAAYNGVLLS